AYIFFLTAAKFPVSRSHIGRRPETCSRSSSLQARAARKRIHMWIATTHKVFVSVSATVAQTDFSRGGFKIALILVSRSQTKKGLRRVPVSLVVDDSDELYH